MGIGVFPEKTQSSKLVTDLAERLGNVLTPESAKAVLDLKIEHPSPERLNELATKANEGVLTSEEFAEFETYAQLRGLVAILQSKARLRNQPTNT